MASTTILVLGHSHTRRLGEFVLQHSSEKISSNFGVAGANVNFYGVGGAKVQELLDSRFTRKVEQYKPHMLILMIGDNDAVHRCSVEELSSKIVATASYFHYALKVPLICVTQLLPRFYSNDCEREYNEQARKVNLALKEQIQTIQYMSFLQYDFARFPTENAARSETLRKYYMDGVHLSDTGYLKMYKTLRSVVIRARAQWKECHQSAQRSAELERGKTVGPPHSVARKAVPLHPPHPDARQPGTRKQVQSVSSTQYHIHSLLLPQQTRSRHM